MYSSIRSSSASPRRHLYVEIEDIKTDMLLSPHGVSDMDLEAAPTVFTPLVKKPLALEKTESLNLIPLSQRIHGYNLLMLMYAADVIIAVTTMGGGNSWIQMERVGSSLTEYDFLRSVACFGTIIAKVIAGYAINYYAKANMRTEAASGRRNTNPAGFRLLVILTLIFQLLTAVLYILSPLLGPWVFYPASILWGLDFSSIVIITYSNKVLDKENLSKYSAQWFIASGAGSILANLVCIALSTIPAIPIYGGLELDAVSAPALVGLLATAVITGLIIRDFDDKGLHTWETSEEEMRDPLAHVSTTKGELPPKMLVVFAAIFNIAVVDLFSGASGTFFYPWLHDQLGWQSARISTMTLFVSVSCISVLLLFTKLSSYYNFRKMNVWMFCQVIFLVSFIGLIRQQSEIMSLVSLLLMSIATTVGGSTLLSFFSGFVKLHPGDNVKLLSIWEVTRAVVAVFAPTLAPLFWCCRYTLMIAGTALVVIAMKLGIIIKLKTKKFGDDL